MCRTAPVQQSEGMGTNRSSNHEVKGRNLMKHVVRRPWYADDRLGWTVYAIGVCAIFAVLWVSIHFEGHAFLSEPRHQGWLMGRMLLGAGAFALSGPVLVTIAQIFMGHRKWTARKMQKFADLDEL